MSGSLDDTIEGHLGHLLHHEPSRLGLMLREGYALAMVVAMCLVGMSVVVVSMGIVTMR